MGITSRNLSIKINNNTMAFGGRDSNSISSPKYVGIGAFKVLAVNPTRADYNKLLNVNISTDPIVYHSSIIVDGKEIPSNRFTFVIQFDPELNHGIDKVIALTMFVEGRYHISSANKCEVIDKYGRTAYADPEDIKAHKPITDSTGRVRVDTSSYRPAFIGESKLIAFIKAQRGILDIEEYDINTGAFKEITDDAERSRREAYISDIKALIGGDSSEVVAALTEYPNNIMKALFGVRHSGDGKDYQSFFDRRFMRGRQMSTSAIKKDLEGAKASGAFASTDFEICDLKVWSPEVTSFDTTSDKKEEVDDLPFGNNPWGI